MCNCKRQNPLQSSVRTSVERNLLLDILDRLEGVVGNAVETDDGLLEGRARESALSSRDGATRDHRRDELLPRAIAGERQGVERELRTHLVGVLEEYVLALGLLEAQIGDGPDNSPSVGERDVHLRSKLAGLVPLGTEDGVTGRVAGVGTRDVSGGRGRRNNGQRVSGGRMGSRSRTYPIFICSAPARILCTA